MKIGVTQYTAHSAGFELVEKALEFGLAGCEPMIADPQSDYLQWDSKKILSLKNYASEKSISIPAIGNAIFVGHDGLVNPDNGDQAFDLLMKSIEFTAQIGAGIMMLCNFFASNPDTDEKKENTIKLLNQLAPKLRQLKVKIALESPIKADELIAMLDSLEDDCFGVYYDTGNAVYLGFDPAEEMVTLGNRILAIHIKDTAEQLGDSHIGLGRCDWAAIWDAIRTIGYKGWLTLETPFGDEKMIRTDIEKIREQL